MKFKTKFDIENWAIKQHIPLHAYFEVTFNCNLKCIHCYADFPHHGRELDFKEVVSVLKQLAKAGTLYITFSGGEPLLRKDFIDIAQSARELGFAISSILTNGTLITEEFADRIYNLFPLGVKLSLFGGTEEAYGRVTGKPHLFRRALQGIRFLSERKVPLTINSQIFNFHTIEDIIAMRRICQDFGVKWKLSSCFSLRKDGDLGPLGYTLSESQFKEVCKRIPEYRLAFSGVQASFNISDNLKSRVCSAQNSISINPYGQIGNCWKVNSKQGIREQSLLTIWKNSPLLKKHRRLALRELSPDCLKCKSFPYCPVCPGDNLSATGSFAKIPPGFCQGAHMLTKVITKLHPCKNKRECAGS